MERKSLGKAKAEYRETYRKGTGRRSQQVWGRLRSALLKIDAATPLVKQHILRMCGLVVMDDGVVLDAELELLRATADAIGAPIPPLVRASVSASI